MHGPHAAQVDADLADKLFELTRGDLDDEQFSRFSFPQLGKRIGGMAIVRIHRLSRFWRSPEGDALMSLEHSAEDLITGLHGHLASNDPRSAGGWLFILRGSSKGVAKEIECWFGVTRADMDQDALGSVLGGAFPDIYVDKRRSFDLSGLNQLRNALVLTGTPSPKGDQRQHLAGDQIEKICRGLYGAQWVYAVYATPVPAEKVREAMKKISQEIRMVQRYYLLKGSHSDEENRLARHYSELLEAQLKRYQKGEATGMWESRCLLLTQSDSLLRRARGLLHSAFSGEQSVPDRVRTCYCDPSRERADNPRLRFLNKGDVPDTILTRYHMGPRLEVLI